MSDGAPPHRGQHRSKMWEGETDRGQHRSQEDEILGRVARGKEKTARASVDGRQGGDG